MFRDNFRNPLRPLGDRRLLDVTARSELEFNDSFLETAPADSHAQRDPDQVGVFEF